MNEKVLLEARNMISGFLRKRREELGMTQEELAEVSCMGIATIKRFESGRFWINMKQYLILCHHLKCYPFLAEKESNHPIVVEMRKAMQEINEFKKAGTN